MYLNVCVNGLQRLVRLVFVSSFRPHFFRPIYPNSSHTGRINVNNDTVRPEVNFFTIIKTKSRPSRYEIL